MGLGNLFKKKEEASSSDTPDNTEGSNAEGTSDAAPSADAAPAADLPPLPPDASAPSVDAPSQDLTPPAPAGDVPTPDSSVGDAPAPVADAPPAPSVDDTPAPEGDGPAPDAPAPADDAPAEPSDAPADDAPSADGEAPSETPAPEGDAPAEPSDAPADDSSESPDAAPAQGGVNLDELDLPDFNEMSAGDAGAAASAATPTDLPDGMKGDTYIGIDSDDKDIQSVEDFSSEDQEFLSTKEIYDFDGPLFVNTKAYRQVLDEIHNIKVDLKKSADIIGNVNDVMRQEDKVYENFQKTIEQVQEKLIFLDQSLF